MTFVDSSSRDRSHYLFAPAAMEGTKNFGRVPGNRFSATIILFVGLFAQSRSHRFAQWLEACAHLFAKELRLLPGREMAAFGELVVMDELGVSLLGPALRRLVDLIWKGA